MVLVDAKSVEVVYVGGSLSGFPSGSWGAILSTHIRSFVEKKKYTAHFQVNFFMMHFYNYA